MPGASGLTALLIRIVGEKAGDQNSPLPPMNILLVNTLYAPYSIGGAERSVQLLAEGLSGRGHRVTVACTSPEEEMETRTVGGVPVHGVPLRNVYWPFDGEKQSLLKPFWHALDSYNPWMRAEFGRLIDAEAPDLIHTHNLGGFTVAVWEAASSRGIPLVHTTRDYSLLCPRNMFRNGENCTSQCWTCRPFVSPRRRLSRHVDTLVGISQFILDRHRKFNYFPNARVQTVIYNPYPVSDEAISNRPQPANAVRFGFLGRLSPRKGIERVLQAVTQMKAPLELYVGGVGEEEYDEYLHSTYAGPDTHFLGFVDPSNFFARIDVLIVPSVWHEPFGRVVIEAYAHGTPVIAACRGGLPEIVDEGETGLVFDPGESGDLRSCVQHFLDNPREISQMRDRVRERALKFDVKPHVKRYENIYERTYEYS